MDGIDEFDADFFGFTPQAARSTDPQHRLFLQTAFHAIEDAGYDPAEFEGSVGVYATSTTSGYLLHDMMSNHDPNVAMGQGLTFDTVGLSMQNDKDYLSTRVSHQFDLRGPALTVETACSSSLVALHLACLSRLSGECDLALAGGVSLRVPRHLGFWHEPGRDGVAHGPLQAVRRGDRRLGLRQGVGIVVLKLLQAAVEAGDRMHAVLRGAAINNDGIGEDGLCRPIRSGSATASPGASIAATDAPRVSYIETHGTATALGDPIELAALRSAFEVSAEAAAPVRRRFGQGQHRPSGAAGVASLIKTILCLKNKAIPATLHFTSPNPDGISTRRRSSLQTEHGLWLSDGVRRAGVSSFGVGGTNAHVSLEEVPPVAARVASGPRPPGPATVGENHCGTCAMPAFESGRRARPPRH